MTLVTWDFHLIVLNHVLLDNGLTIAKSGGLVRGEVVKASLGNEAIVAWYVRGCFRCANSELVIFVANHFSIASQFVPRVVTVSAKRLLELSLEVASLGRVGLPWVAPNGSLTDSQVRAHLRLISVLRVRLPVLRCVSQ